MVEGEEDIDPLQVPQVRTVVNWMKVRAPKRVTFVSIVTDLHCALGGKLVDTSLPVRKAFYENNWVFYTFLLLNWKRFIWYRLWWLFLNPWLCFFNVSCLMKNIKEWKLFSFLGIFFSTGSQLIVSLWLLMQRHLNNNRQATGEESSMYSLTRNISMWTLMLSLIDWRVLFLHLMETFPVKLRQTQICEFFIEFVPFTFCESVCDFTDLSDVQFSNDSGLPSLAFPSLYLFFWSFFFKKSLMEGG